MANVLDPDFDEPREQPGFSVRRARVGAQAGAKRLGASVWELPPGQAAYPYHFHLVEEELLIVLAGTPSLRTPDGWRKLETGEVVSFARGESGAHQLTNDGGQPARVLAVSTSASPDIVVYPDSGKVGVSERLPGRRGLHELYRRCDSVDYWEGESPPPPPDDR